MKSGIFRWKLVALRKNGLPSFSVKYFELIFFCIWSIRGDKYKILISVAKPSATRLKWNNRSA